MGIREGLLVLLGDGPKYGYQLKVDFESATGEAWPLNVGQVYTTLQRLERDGLVAEAETDDEGRVSYALTDGGRTEFIDWMTTAEKRAVPARDEVAMKVLLAASSDPAAGGIDPSIVIDEQRRATMANLQEYTRLRSKTEKSSVGVDDPSGADELAWLLQLDRLIHLRQAELRWLDDAEERLQTAGVAPRKRPAANRSKNTSSTTPDPTREGTQS